MQRKGNGSDGTEIRFQAAISPRQLLTATVGSYMHASDQNLTWRHPGDQGQMITHTEDGSTVGKSDDMDNEKAQEIFSCFRRQSPE